MEKGAGSSKNWEIEQGAREIFREQEEKLMKQLDIDVSPPAFS